MVWIQSFHFRRLVAYPRLKNPVCLNYLPIAGGIGDGFILFPKGISTMLSKQPCPGFELEKPSPFPMTQAHMYVCNFQANNFSMLKKKKKKKRERENSIKANLLKGREKKKIIFLTFMVQNLYKLIY